MPSIQPPARILVTGATGYIAIWVVRSLLDAGFSVVGTVRSSSKAQYLHQTFASEVEQGRFESVIVEDMQVPGAFDHAVKGVGGIAHTASPVHLHADDPNELIKPAVHGTLGILESAKKYAPECKRIIILSSLSTVIKDNPGRPLTEEDWNDTAVEAVERQGRDATPMNKYRASKILAERAAWDFHTKHKDEVGWDIVTITPPYVFGPVLHQVSSPEGLNTSMSEFYNVLCRPNAGGKTDEQLLVPLFSRVDVRDVATAHTKSFMVDEAGGNRFIICAAPYTWQELLDVAHSVFPQSQAIHRGRPGAGKNVIRPITFDSSKSKRVLGLEYRPLEDTVKDSLVEFERRGWFKVV